MNIDTLLTDTFAAHEDLAPDADGVLAAVRERTARRHAGLVQPLAIAASVVVVAGVAGGAVVLSRPGSHPATHQVQQAAGRPQPVPTERTGIEPLTMPFDLGWLPTGSVAYHARRINVGALSGSDQPVFDGEYLLTVTTSTGALNIDVQQMPGGLDGVQFKSGPGTPVTINGRDGIESTNAAGPGGYEVYFLNAAGGLMYVNVAPGTDGAGSAAQLTAMGRRVAAQVRFPGTAQVEPSFGVGYVPAGLQVRAFDVETGGTDVLKVDGSSGPTTSYELGTTTDLQSAAIIGTNTGPPSGTPGRAVQGHPTRYDDEDGYRSLYVLGAIDGQAVLIAGRLPLAELYAIADGLVLPQ